jgi:hypothetical protein
MQSLRNSDAQDFITQLIQNNTNFQKNQRHHHHHHQQQQQQQQQQQRIRV